MSSTTVTTTSTSTNDTTTTPWAREQTLIKRLESECRTHATEFDVDPVDIMLEDGEMSLRYGRALRAEADGSVSLYAHGNRVRKVAIDERGRDIFAAAVADGERENGDFAASCDDAVVAAANRTSAAAALATAAAEVEAAWTTLALARARRAQAFVIVERGERESVAALVAAARAGTRLYRPSLDHDLRTHDVAVGTAHSALRRAVAELMLAAARCAP
jgi:hypothetical protein